MEKQFLVWDGSAGRAPHCTSKKHGIFYPKFQTKHGMTLENSLIYKKYIKKLPNKLRLKT